MVFYGARLAGGMCIKAIGAKATLGQTRNMRGITTELSMLDNKAYPFEVKLKRLLPKFPKMYASL